MMLTIGDSLPEFSCQATVSNDLNTAFSQIDHRSYAEMWKVIFFWPKDFTFVCPTEIVAFIELNAEFHDRNTQILGVSVDSEFVHLAWRNQHPDLEKCPFPMLADVKRDLSQSLGVLDAREGVAQRATFLVDPKNIIRYACVTDMNVGRNPQEVLRVLDALQSEQMCPCNWQKGDDFVKTS